jgi:2-keto-4-pentenoate hydratase
MSAKAAAQYLVEARMNARLIKAFSPDLAPASVQQAYAIQDEIISLSGSVGGWKIAPRPNGGEFLCSPIPAAFFVPHDTQIGRADFLAPEAEVEIAARFGRDLPPKSGDYSLEEVIDAIESLHPIIEILSSRFEDRKATDQVSNIADLQSCGAVVVGAACGDWRAIEMATVPLALSIDGQEVTSVSGGASSHHVLAAITWLANHSAARNGGLKKGQIVITGARVGPIAVKPGARVTGRVGPLGDVRAVI